jgi:hypothetical protein
MHLRGRGCSLQLQRLRGYAAECTLRLASFTLPPTALNLALFTLHLVKFKCNTSVSPSANGTILFSNIQLALRISMRYFARK